MYFRFCLLFPTQHRPPPASTSTNTSTSDSPALPLLVWIDPLLRPSQLPRSPFSSPTMSDAPLPHDFEDADGEGDALSFCDLPLAALHYPDGSCPALPLPSPPRDASDFEFPTGPSVSPVDAFLFCGKSTHFDERQYRVDSLLLRSDSFDRLNGFRRDGAQIRFTSGRLLRSSSLRVARSRSSVAPAAASVGSSSSRRRHRALIGITKFPAKMELSDIRKRQGRRAPAPLFPSVEGGKQFVAGGRSGRHWSLLRPLRCRSHLASALAKASLGCIPHA